MNSKVSKSPLTKRIALVAHYNSIGSNLATPQKQAMLFDFLILQHLDHTKI